MGHARTTTGLLLQVAEAYLVQALGSALHSKPLLTASARLAPANCPTCNRFLSPRWDRERVMEAAVVLFWINVGLSLTCTTLLPFYFFKTRR